MGNKMLTVSVAAYNVASFLRETLESCVIPEVLDDLEVIVVNDGSTDETARIAEEYQKRYPLTFRLINKENGGYGTTVNRSIEEAEGKYFKLLDGDDRFNQKGLRQLVEFLRQTDADWVITRRIKYADGTDEKEEESPLWLKFCDRIYQPEEIADSRFSSVIGMWQVTVRTEILKQRMMKLPEHRLYTDQLFVYYQMSHIRSIAFLNYSVYEYRIGREEQSVSRTSSVKHADERIENLRMMLGDYALHHKEYGLNREFIAHRLMNYYCQGILLYCMLPVSRDHRTSIMKLEKKCKSETPDVYYGVYHYRRMIPLLRYTHYYAYYLLARRELCLPI
jgi:glycosyltransferase involved in cell wall biosynthesis